MINHVFHCYMLTTALQPYTTPQLTGHDIPVLKMLRRKIHHFEQGARASIKLVFHATQPVMVRWFRLDDSFTSQTSEVPNMLPVEGKPLALHILLVDYIIILLSMTSFDTPGRIK